MLDFKVTNVWGVPSPNGFWAAYMSTDSHPVATRVYSFNMPQLNAGDGTVQNAFATTQWLQWFTLEELATETIVFEVRLESDDAADGVGAWIRGVSPAP